MLGYFEGWEQEAQELLDVGSRKYDSLSPLNDTSLMQCCDNPSRWAISHVRHLPYYVVDRVALLGDAVSKYYEFRTVS